MRTIELRQLRYFSVLCKELHFGRAAELAFVTQPALSQQIAKLEEQIGLQLFGRDRRQVQLTAAGRVFRDGVDKIFAELELSLRLARQAGDQTVFELSLGMVEYTALPFLPASMIRLQALYPDVKIARHEMNAAGQIEALLQRQIDVGFGVPVSSLPSDGEILSEPILESHWTLLVQDSHRLASLGSIRLDDLAENGNRVGRHLFYDIKSRGYTGSRSNLERLLKVWRAVENIEPDEPPPNIDVSEPVRDPDTGHMISSVVAAALCIKPRGLLTDRQARKVNALKQGSRAFAIMRGLAMRFNGILRSGRSQALDEWIDDAIDTELTAIMRFASVLRRDIDALKNAIELPWSNSQAEGQINRLKMLKRAMYGRADPELMRARMLPLNHRN